MDFIKDIWISLFPDWLSNVATAFWVGVFLFLWHHGREVLKDIKEVFASSRTFYFIISIIILLWLNREYIPTFTEFLKRNFFQYFMKVIEWCTAMSILYICIYRKNIISFFIESTFLSLVGIILMSLIVYLCYRFFVITGEGSKQNILRNIILYISIKNVIYCVIAIIFEHMLNIAVKRGRALEKLNLTKSFFGLLGVITILVVSYKIAEYEREKPLYELRKTEAAKKAVALEKSRLKAKAMFAENMPLAKNGNAQAQYNLGFYFHEYEHDKRQALYWYTKSAENNFARSQYILGCHYSGKFGSYSPNAGVALVDVDYTQALYWHNKASENGYSASDYELYVMYCEGIGVEKNYIKAYMYLFIMKYTEGTRFYHQRELDSLSRKLTKSQIITAKKKAQGRFHKTKTKANRHLIRIAGND